MRWLLSALILAAIFAALAHVILPLGFDGGNAAPAQEPTPQSIRGTGAVALPPGGTVTFAPISPRAPPGPMPTRVPAPIEPFTVDNQSSQIANVSFEGGLVIIVPSESAIQLRQSPTVWRFCRYGEDVGGGAISAPANIVACGITPLGIGTIVFTTIPWTSDESMTMRVAYPAGWNLVAAPEGTALAAIDSEGRPAGVKAPLYTLQTSDATYESLPASTNLRAGIGYWAYFDPAATVTLLTSGPQSLNIDLPPGQFVMIGNPGEAPVTVAGADLIYTYDSASAQYEQTTTLQPGQGAWAYSAAGATISLTPASP